MMGRWTFDSDDPNEAMDAGHFDTEKVEKGSEWRVKIGGRILGVVPESKIIPKKR